ncbi:MAG: DUF2344 domain-containing protein [Clostridia bacterium]|nr:DUF2344 domain-containing protein [Clostridia bacterium]
MNKYFVKYGKDHRAQYISHLDFLRTIGRAMRRAQLPLEYSQGFNPHPLITFAAPISVGIKSECEMFCVRLTEDITAEEFKERLTDAMPDCLPILEVTKDEIEFKSINSADYEIETEKPVSDELINAFMAEPQILIDKKTKKGIKETDIKADIFDISVQDNIISATLKTSDSGSLKPMLLISAMNKYGIDTGFCRYLRLRFRDTDKNVI